MAEITKARTDLKSPKDFPWAYNKLKLKQAYSYLFDLKKSDKNIVIDEESIKEEYIRREGLLTDDQQKNIAKKRPRSTSNMDKLDQR